MEVLPWAECLPCCLPHRLLLLQAELGRLSRGGSNPCNNTHCQLTSLGAGAGSPAILASLQALSQPDPSSSPKRSSLLVPRKTWCWSKVWEMGKAVPFLHIQLSEHLKFLSAPLYYSAPPETPHTHVPFPQFLWPPFAPGITTQSPLTLLQVFCYPSHCS